MGFIEQARPIGHGHGNGDARKVMLTADDIVIVDIHAVVFEVVVGAERNVPFALHLGTKDTVLLQNGGIVGTHPRLIYLNLTEERLFQNQCPDLYRLQEPLPNQSDTV